MNINQEDTTKQQGAQEVVPSPADGLGVPKTAPDVLVLASLEEKTHGDWCVNFRLRGQLYTPWVYPLPEEHAAFIVRAVNAHEELVKALRTALRCMDGAGMYSRGGSDRETFLEVKAALSKLEAP